MREPQQHGDSQRPGERGGEDRVDRAHVREHRARPRPSRQLARERALEAQPPADTEPGAEEPDAAVVGKGAVDGAVAEDDELVDPRGERPQLGDRGAEHGTRRVDLLGDDDEPHRRASTARPTSSTTRSAYSSGE